jgi:hypothetical protein
MASMSLGRLFRTWSRRMTARAGSGRHRPALERLEDRALRSLGFASAFGLAASFPSPEHIAIDAAGDLFVTGSFLGTANFDPGMSSAGVRSASSTAPNTFVAEYSPAGALDWVTYFASLTSGTTGDGSLSTGIAVDPQTGSIYVVGQFQGMVNFDPGGAARILTSSSATASDAYIVELPSSGDIAQGLVKSFGNGMGGPAFNSVTLSASGQNVFVTGGFQGAVNFDPGGTNTTLTSPPDGGALVLQLTNTLGFVLARQAGIDSSEGVAIAVDASGTTSIAGEIDATQDSFVARFDSAGNLLAERTFLGPHVPGMNDFATSLVTDGTSVYVAGTFRGNGVNFNATTGTAAVTLDSRGDSDAFLIKLDARLDIVWAYRYGSPGADTGAALAIGASGDLYLTGSVSGLSSFGMTGLGMVIFAPGNGLSATPDTYVLHVDPSGDPTISPAGPTGSGSSHATTIAVNAAGEVGIAGIYSPPIIFGNTYLQAPGTTVPFLATLTENFSGGGGGGSGGSTLGGSGGAGASAGGSPGPAPGAGGSSVAPSLILTGERPIRAGAGRKKKVIGFQLFFSAPVQAGSAENASHYQVTQPGRSRQPGRKVVPVVAASLDPSGTSVTLVLARYDLANRLTLTATGLVAASGTPAATIVTRL